MYQVEALVTVLQLVTTFIECRASLLNFRNSNARAHAQLEIFWPSSDSAQLQRQR